MVSILSGVVPLCQCFSYFTFCTIDTLAFQCPYAVLIGTTTNKHCVPFLFCSFVAQALRGSTVLSVLKLRNCNIDSEGTKRLAGALADIHTLTILDLSFNSFCEDGGSILGKECVSHAWSSSTYYMMVIYIWEYYMQITLVHRFEEFLKDMVDSLINYAIP